MNSLKEVISKIKNLEDRIKALEMPSSKPKGVSKGKAKKSLTDFVIDLRNEGFFKLPKTAGEVQEKLVGVYHCKVDRVVMCLHRVADKKHLRKATKKISGKKYIAYVW